MGLRCGIVPGAAKAAQITHERPLRPFLDKFRPLPGLIPGCLKRTPRRLLGAFKQKKRAGKDSACLIWPDTGREPLAEADSAAREASGTTQASLSAGLRGPQNSPWRQPQQYREAESVRSSLPVVL